MDSTVFLYSSTTRRRFMFPAIAPTPLGETHRPEILLHPRAGRGRQHRHPLREDTRLADIETKHLKKQRHRELINKIRDFGP